MAYERTTTEGICSWLTTEANTPGWNTLAISRGLTEDVMTVIVEHFQEFDSTVKQDILLSTVCMSKGDLMSLGGSLNQIIQLAKDDANDFVQTSARIIESYPSQHSFNLNVDHWSPDFQDLLTKVGKTVKEQGIQFHLLEDMILQPNARTTPPYVASDYAQYKPTQKQHFQLTTNQDDIMLAETRHARFKEIVEMEQRSEEVEAQSAQAAAQKRAGAELLSGPSKRPTISPTANPANPFPFPPHRNSNIPVSPGAIFNGNYHQGMAGRRSSSLNAVSSAVAGPSSSLFTKRPARPTAGGGSLFIKQTRPAGGAARPVQRSSSISSTSLPKGLQRVQRTQMIDFNAASEFEQNTANEIKRAQDDIKAQAEARKQEVAERKRRALEERRERMEANKRSRKKEPKPIDTSRRASASSSSPRTPTTSSSVSPTIQHEHPLIPALTPQEPKEQQQTMDSSSSRRSSKASTSSSEKLTTF